MRASVIWFYDERKNQIGKLNYVLRFCFHYLKVFYFKLFFHFQVLNFISFEKKKYDLSVDDVEHLKRIFACSFYLYISI
jgi:hypothetical protein